MAYVVKLEQFEGPLDLLLYLIQREEMDIYDIQIARITDSYLRHIEAMDRLDLDPAGDFLVMAATLLRIKARIAKDLFADDDIFGHGDADTDRHDTYIGDGFHDN